MKPQDVPVFIAGGGIAGLATAISLLQRGIHCTLAEPNYSANAKPSETIPPRHFPFCTNWVLRNC